MAKQCYIKAIKAGEATDDVHTSAFASYELGMTLCRNPEVGIKWAFDVKKSGALFEITLLSLIHSFTLCS